MLQLAGLFRADGGLRALRNFSIMRELKAITHSVPKCPTALPQTGVVVKLCWLMCGVWQGVPVIDLVNRRRKYESHTIQLSVLF